METGRLKKKKKKRSHLFCQKIFSTGLRWLLTREEELMCRNTFDRWRDQNVPQSHLFKKILKKNISQSLILTCQVVRWRGDYLFCFRFVTSTSLTLYYSHVRVRCLQRHLYPLQRLDGNLISFFFSYITMETRPLSTCQDSFSYWTNFSHTAYFFNLSVLSNKNCTKFYKAKFERHVRVCCGKEAVLQRVLFFPFKIWLLVTGTVIFAASKHHFLFKPNPVKEGEAVNSLLVNICTAWQTGWLILQRNISFGDFDISPLASELDTHVHSYRYFTDIFMLRKRSKLAMQSFLTPLTASWIGPSVPPPLSAVCHQSCGGFAGWRSCTRTGGWGLEVLFLEDPPFGLPSVWQWAGTDVSCNLCKLQCRELKWLGSGRYYRAERL